jgi:hypothetical protein
MENLTGALELAALTFFLGLVMCGLVGAIVIVISKITSGREAGGSL